MLREVEKQFGELRLSVRVVVNNRDELSIIGGETKITFHHFPFPVILPAVPLGNFPGFSVKEIGAMKAYTLGRRGTMKDYVDLYFILKSGETLESIAEHAAKKFGEAFDTRLFLEQIVYLEDIDEAPVKFLKEPVGKKELEVFFQDQVRRFGI